MALAERHASAGVRLLPVSVDRRRARGAEYLVKVGYRGIAAYDPGAESSIKLGIDGIPTVLILDAAGVEMARVVGSGAEALQRIEAALNDVLASERVLHVE